MIRILIDTDLPALEANVNGIIREEYQLKLKDVKFDIHQMKDFFQHDGTICNQWIEYSAVIIFESK